MTLQEPPINTSVTLDVPGWAAPRRTRVEDLDHEVIVAAPLGEGDDHEPSLGTTMDVEWKGARGPMALRARLVAKELRTVPTWRLEPDGRVVITQRRHHVRAGGLIPVVLRTACGPMEVQAVDLSEGGARLVRRGLLLVEVGDQVDVEVTVADRELVLPSEVVRLETDGTRCFAGCRFTAISDRDADVVRRFVFDRQARAR